jgi:hypothetical protein
MKWTYPVIVISILLVIGCKQSGRKSFSEADLVGSWIDLALYITKNTPANSPTYASRCFGYIGLTMFESVVHGSPVYQSLAGQLSGLKQLPLPLSEEEYQWQHVLNAAQAEILRLIYIQTSEKNKRLIDRLEKENKGLINQFFGKQSALSASYRYGGELARAIFEWSKEDGGHRGYLKNFDKHFVTPECVGCWGPALYSQNFSHKPLHPFWGQNRLFVPNNRTLPLPEIIEFDTTPDSEYYREMQQVYEQGNSLSIEEKQTAIWWSDDPDSTYTPPGHSVYLMNKAIQELDLDMVDAAMLYAALGMGLADAYIKCWEWKYLFFTERPNYFINRFIDARWESFWPDPPFPAFPSGHAIQGSVAAEILQSYFGEGYSFMDDIHEMRPKDEIRDIAFVSRRFSNFKEMAMESANSRFYGGIHLPQDNLAGLKQGALIGQNVLMLSWKK